MAPSKQLSNRVWPPGAPGSDNALMESRPNSLHGQSLSAGFVLGLFHATETRAYLSLANS